MLKGGGVGGRSLKAAKVFNPLDSGSKAKPPDGTRTLVGSGGKEPAGGEARSKPRTPAEAAAVRLTDDLVKAVGEQRTALLKQLCDTKGPEYTEALAGVIARLEGDNRRLAREALADRLTRMKPATLREYFKDEAVEIRRAAALAAAQQDAKALIPDLIRLLSDPESLVERAAHAALKELSGKDFGPSSDADRSERAKAIAAWQVWLKKQTRR